MRGALLILKKEFLELSKDRKTIFFAFVMPLLLWPLIFSMILSLEKTDSKRREDKASRIWLVDPGRVITSRLQAEPKLFELVSQPSGDIRQAIKDQKLELFVEIPSDAQEKIARQETCSIKVLTDESESSSSLALKRLRKVVSTQEKDLVAARLQAIQAPPQLAEPMNIASTNVADMGLQMGKLLGSFLPYLLLIMMYSGSMQPGIYTTAGEKERGTLQCLLATRLPRNQIILGKLLYVFLMGVISAVLNLASMGFTFTKMVGAAMAQDAPVAATGHGMGMPAMSAVALGLSFLLMIPLGLLFANFIVFMGIQAKNTHEAGTALAPGIFVVVFLGIFSSAPGIEKMLWVPYVPVMNVSLAIRKLFSQQGDPVQYLVALGMTVLLAAVMTWISTRLLDRESAIFKQS
ncbi:MAG TPA: ABC transporter permease [Holophaga sp.]|jgi:sodium transport system permease protein|nr:ABC transporter permease [Holophaga sp.]